MPVSTVNLLWDRTDHQDRTDPLDSPASGGASIRDFYIKFYRYIGDTYLSDYF